MQRALGRGAAALDPRGPARELDRAAPAARSLPTRSAPRRSPAWSLGAGLGFSPWLGAFGVRRGLRRGAVGPRAAHKLDPGAITGILLATALAAGSVLASYVFQSVGERRRAALRKPARHRQDDLVAHGSCSTSPASPPCSLGGRGLLAVSFAPDAAASLGYRRGWSTTPALLLAARRCGGLELGRGRRVRRLGPAGRAGGDRPPAGPLARQLQLGASCSRRSSRPLGLVLAFQLDVPPGAAIAVLAASVYLVLVLASPARSPRASRRPAIAGELA